MVEKEIEMPSQEIANAIYGNLDGNLDYIEREFSVAATGRGCNLILRGEPDCVEAAHRTVEAMKTLLKTNGTLDEQAVIYAVKLAKSKEDGDLTQLNGSTIVVTNRGKAVKPKTVGQEKYVEAIRNNYIVFGVGPAGTGKTYLAVAMAVKALKNHEITRIILTIPAVEAGESLGFLPGDLQNKVDPYLRPLYDALFDMMGAEGYQKQLERGVIEVAPLAYMRGRTLENAFVILDEAQNTTREQMKMFLTRLGSGSKMVVNGDVTQIDLGENKVSGLVDAMKVLKNIDGIEKVLFTEKDVVRFKLVADIVKAYEKDTLRRQGGKKHGQ
jgi:phosphate starvation-inducible PhoH-like protein